MSSNNNNFLVFDTFNKLLFLSLIYVCFYMTASQLSVHIGKSKVPLTILHVLLIHETHSKIPSYVKAYQNLRECKLMQKCVHDLLIPFARNALFLYVCLSHKQLP